MEQGGPVSTRREPECESCSLVLSSAHIYYRTISRRLVTRDKIATTISRSTLAMHLVPEQARLLCFAITEHECCSLMHLPCVHAH